MGHRGVTPVLYPLKGKLFSYKMLVLGCRTHRACSVLA